MDLADADGAGGVRNAEVDVVEGALWALGQVHHVAGGAVGDAIGGLEIEHTVDGAVRVEGQALDCVLRVVGEEAIGTSTK